MSLNIVCVNSLMLRIVGELSSPKLKRAHYKSLGLAGLPGSTCIGIQETPIKREVSLKVQLRSTHNPKKKGR
jgi:hypothetical protein